MGVLQRLYFKIIKTHNIELLNNFRPKLINNHTMADDQQFCLRWNDFQTNMVASFKHLRDEKSFCDVTIATEGQHTKAHKMILCACSPYFKNLLEQNPAKHPIIILKDVPFMHLTAILEFMYAGEVNVAQDQLPAFLKTAEKLKIKGLAEGEQGKEDGMA